MASTESAQQPLARPNSAAGLFLAFNRLALRGFGGVLPWAQRVVVEEERWLDNREFVEQLALAQVLPGPNVVNLALMIGDRFFGLRGAFAALAGLMAAPLAIVLTLALLYAGFATRPEVGAALRGMGAVSAGLIVAMAVKLAPTQRRNVAGWAFIGASFVAVGVLRWPLLWVMPVLGGASVLLTARGLRK